MFAAERHIAVTRLVIKENPIVAFVHNVTAYDIFPYHVEIRRQIPGAFLSMMATDRAQIEPEAAEVVWAIGQSVSPWDTASLVSRGAYFLNYGRRNELGFIAERLKRIAPWSIETWIIEAYTALVANDRPRMEAALRKTESIPHQEQPALRALTEELRRLP